MTERYDLHSHTTASDGAQAPADNVRLALAAGLSGLAITDHDTVAGVAEAVAEGRRLGVEVIPGVEISTAVDGRDIHVLGYYIDVSDAQLLRRLDSQRNTREQRNRLILQRLAELGVDVTMEEVRAQSRNIPGKEDTIGRPHIAAALVAKGAVATIGEAFDRYLAGDAPGFVRVDRIHPETAIDWIREAGGVPVLAHPGLYRDEALVQRLIDYGIAGIETSHPDHRAEDEALYARLAEEHGLIATAGSDFHGSREGVAYHAALGSRHVGPAALALLRAASSYYGRSLDLR